MHLRECPALIDLFNIYNSVVQRIKYLRCLDKSNQLHMAPQCEVNASLLQLHDRSWRHQSPGSSPNQRDQLAMKHPRKTWQST